MTRSPTVHDRVREQGGSRLPASLGSSAFGTPAAVLAARARELVDQGAPIEPACRIVTLEDQPEEARNFNAEQCDGGVRGRAIA
ncbi:hypothetical protein [Streptomyces sp. T12]|uniref:hypothetical protein n=1 Tax=Streptomyces sp. T12 TaxID=477697 RepID=UPI0037D9D4F0